MTESAAPQTKAVIEVDGVGEIEDCTSFCYQNEVLAIGDPFAVTVANPRGKYRGKLRKGLKITLRLSNPEVNNGQLTLKHTGRIVRPEYISDGGGTRVQLNCADLGWHLANCDASLKVNLQRGSLEDLFGEPLIDRSWGLYGDFSGPQGSWRARLITDSETSRLLRLGIRLSKSQAAATNLAGVFQRVYVVQSEPGDKVADILMLYARRINRLVNVSADGKIQVWNPDFSQKPLYRIEYHDDDRRTRNNILSVRARDDLAGTFTEVVCVGEIVGLEYAQIDPNDPNAGKVYGTYTPPTAPLPFVHRRTFCDGEMFVESLAAKQAEWHFKRALYDSWSYEVRVKGHHQDGTWWEADAMCSVDDSIHGVTGNYYVASVRYERTKEGDVTDVVLRPPGLLSAAFGVLPVSPRASYNPNLGRAVSGT